MRRIVLVALPIVLLLAGPVAAKEHPRYSLGFTEILQTSNWIDTGLLELSALKNLENGLGLGLKAGTDFQDEIDVSLLVKKTMQEDVYLYGCLGYSIDAKDGGFAEIGLATYFLDPLRLGIHLGWKYYFGPNLSSVPIGFTVHF